MTTTGLDNWVCGCGHNKSEHRYEWNPFLGKRNTACKGVARDISQTRCGCEEFKEAT